MYDSRSEEEIMAANNQWDNTNTTTTGGSTVDNARTATFVDPSSKNYRGPIYELYVDDDGNNALRKKTDPVSQFMQYQWEQERDNPGTPNATPEAPPSETVQPPPPTRNSDLNPYADLKNLSVPTFDRANPLATAPRVSTQSNMRLDPRLNVDVPDAFRDLVEPQKPGDQAPRVDTSKIDPLLKKNLDYQNMIESLIAADNASNLSEAEAQLQQGREVSKRRAAMDLEANQRATLGQARSARNRGDVVLAERQATGEAAFLGQEAARNQSLQDAVFEGDMARLRAEEAREDRQFTLDAIKQAAELGLNTAAMQLDVSKADLDSTNNWINNEFEQLGLNKQLDQRQTEALMEFTKAMAMLDFDYAQLSSNDQNALLDAMVRQYGIDKDYALGIKKIKEDNDWDWWSTVNAMVAGGSSGAGQALGTLAFGGSDERIKHDSKESGFSDPIFEKLMAAASPYTFEYNEEDDGPVSPIKSDKKSGLNFGLMAQNLEKSPVGKSLVHEEDGIKVVNGAKAGLAALAGLSAVFSKLQEIESRLD